MTRRPFSLESQERRLGIILVLPIVVLMAGFIAYPFAYNFWLAFNSKHLLSPSMNFIGLRNFSVLVGKSEFWLSLKNQIIWASATVSLQLVLGIGTALLLNMEFRGRSLARALILIPYVTSPVVVALIWKWMLNDVNGIINYFLMATGIVRSPIVWLGLERWAMPTIIFIAAWEWFPFVTICVLSRLQTIPQEIYEAARVDGSSSWQSFLHITLPQLSSVLFIIILLRGIWMFNKFDIIWLLTGGGPVRATQTLPLLSYFQIFSSFKLGLGAATNTFMFLFMTGVAIIYFKFYKVSEEV